MDQKANERFDRLLKAMVQGEPPKRKGGEPKQSEEAKKSTES